ncbi:SDR family oxidoreductase, partial [Desulfocucumis palustris]|uniref:SDR family oxidoreductase n=1 Tax=Desulfocucumis palustris TaxID=1898651 RepID=UPI000F0B75BB
KAIDGWIIKGKYAKLLNLWVKGLIVDWNNLYGETKPRRISLPTYPFAGERYWAPEMETGPAGNGAGAALAVTASIHPLLHQNTSDFSEQRFSSTFTGREFFLADHVVKGRRVLPGMACLEMARAAVDKAAGALKEGKAAVRLKNIVWARPIALGEQPVQIHIGLFPGNSGEIAYRIYSEPGALDTEPVVHSQGSATLSPASKAPILDLKALQARCSRGSLSSGGCYQAFRAMGIDYGPGYRGIEKVYVGQGQVLAKLSLPPSVSGTAEQFVLHPGLLDSALQASIGLVMSPDDPKAPRKPFLPFALQELEVLGSCTSSMWAFIQYSGGSVAGDRVQKLDIDLCDGQGKVCARMKGFSTRALEGEVSSTVFTATSGTLMLHPRWKERAVAREAPASEYARHLVMLLEPGEDFRESIETQMGGVRCLTLESKQNRMEERFQTYAVQAFEEIQSILKDQPGGKVLLQIVTSAQQEQQLFSGLAGLLKTARLENPKIIGQLIEVDPGEDAAGIVNKLRENSRSPIDKQIRYQDGGRYVAGWSEVEASREEAALPWRDRGVYLITGGAGGLGLIFAREIAQKVKDATLILAGRAPLSGEKQARLNELETLGARIEYKQVDVTQKKAVAGLLRSIREDFGNINGIIHGAGVIRDNFIIKKT